MIGTKRFLEKTRELISSPSHWCKNYWAKDRKGCPVDPDSEVACRWCLDGAMRCVAVRNNIPMLCFAHSKARDIIFKFLVKENYSSVPDFNDITTHKKVMELLAICISSLVRKKKQ